MKKLFQFLGLYEKYSCHLSKQEMIEMLENISEHKFTFDLKVERVYFSTYGFNKIEIQRVNYGLEVFNVAYPLMKMEVEQENPTILEVKFIPSYFKLFFLLFIGSVFTISSFLMNEITVNGILREVVYTDRLLFFGLGSLLLVWGYFRCIRPIHKSKLWLIEHFEMEKLN